jgi:hypothetical protein
MRQRHVITAGRECPSAQARGRPPTGPEAQVASLGVNHETAIVDRATLAAFMDEEAEAFARGAVDDYTRARVLHDSDELFAQPAFATMLATARAEAYPIALSMIAETIEAALAPHTEDRAAQLRGLMWAVLKAFDRRPRPEAVSAPAWDAARTELLRWLGTLRPPKTTEVIADSFAGPLLALMPVHDRLGRDDYTCLRGAMHTDLASIVDRFVQSADAPALARALVATS